MFKRYIFFSLVFFAFFYTKSQTVSDQFEKGSILFDNGVAFCDYNLADERFCPEAGAFFKQAIVHFEDAIKDDAENAECNFKLGICYLINKKYSKAVGFISKAYEINASVDPQIEYYLARAYQLSGNRTDAIEFYLAFSDKLKKGDIAKKYVIEEDILEKKIAECTLADSLDKIKPKYTVTNLGDKINTEESEYGAVLSKSGYSLLFTSKRPDFRLNTGDVDSIDFATTDENKIENIYISYKKNGEWAQSKVIGDILSEVGEHKAILDITDDSRAILIYKSQKGGDIFKGNYSLGDWEGMAKLEGDLNSLQNEPSACYNNDMTAIFFSSNRHGGLGEKDIYMVEKDSTGWNKPVNLGEEINTPEDEDGVFISDDGKTLYFASKGHEGIGGYDIYKTTRTDSGWTEPKNLGLPFNSPADDIFYSENANGTEAYITSDREGTLGLMDIFKIETASEQKEDSKKQEIKDVVVQDYDKGVKPIKLSGSVTEFGSNKAVSATVNLRSKEGNILFGKTDSDASGKFSLDIVEDMKYTIEISADGYEILVDEISIDVSAENFTYDAQLVKAQEISITEKPLMNKGNNNIFVKGYALEYMTNKPVSADIIIKGVDNDFNEELKNNTETSEFTISLAPGKKYRIFAKAKGYLLQSELLSVNADVKTFLACLCMIPESTVENKNISSSIDTNHRKAVIYSGVIKEFNTDKIIPNAGIEFYNIEDSSLIHEMKADNNGRFSVALPSQQYYKLMVNADGYLYQRGYVNATHETDFVFVDAEILRQEDAILKNNVDELLISQKQQQFSLLEGQISDFETKKPITGALKIYDTETGECISIFKTNNEGKFLAASPQDENIDIKTAADGYNSRIDNLDIPDSTQIVSVNIPMVRSAITNISITIEDILFATAKFDVTSDFAADLKKFAQMVAKQKNLHVKIAGHTDSKGSDFFNQRLSEKRAKSIAKFLEDAGIDESRVHYTGYGETKPVADNETEEGRQKNRRVEIEVYTVE